MLYPDIMLKTGSLSRKMIDIGVIGRWVMIAELSQAAIVVGIILLVFDISSSVYFFYIRNDVTLANRGARGALTVVLLVLLVVSCLAGGAIYNQNAAPIVGYTFFLSCIIYTITIYWMFSQLNGMKERSMEVLETLTSILEVGEPNLDGHMLHVHNLSMLIYDYLPSQKKRNVNRQNLQYASLFIDLGKLGIPGRVINKAGKLGADEWKLVKMHPQIAVNILEPILSFEEVTEWIRYHHERVDGTGYNGLKGGEIPLASRIIALADTFSAITMPRAYRPTLTYEDAIAELKLATGSQLDPELVKIFIEIPKESVLACMEDVKEKMSRAKVEINEEDE